MTEQYLAANKYLGGQGERVLAFAWIYLEPLLYPSDFKFNFESGHYNFPMQDLCFVGLVSLNDPPRKYVDYSVQKCRKAGIKVIMVTGDQPLTAASIAKKVGIITDDENIKTNVELID